MIEKQRATPELLLPIRLAALLIQCLAHLLRKITQVLVMLFFRDRTVLPNSIQHLLLTEKELMVFLGIAQSSPCVVVMVYIHDNPCFQQNRVQSAAQRGELYHKKRLKSTR